jgi:Fur family ferric uptake transcriptional regulator
VKADLERLEDVLRSRDLKVTRTRRLIFAEILASPETHLDVGEIHARLQRKGRHVSLATIYRTLRLLVRNGFVSRVDFGESHGHYERKGAKAGHGHLICLACGRVSEFADERIQGAVGAIGAAEAFELDKFSLQIFGYCRACKR